jgi:hypothetical protein
VEEDDEITFLASNEIYAVIASNELNSPREANIPPTGQNGRNQCVKKWTY